MSNEKVKQDKNDCNWNKTNIKSYKNGEISDVFIADDADRQMTQEVASLAEELGISCHRVG